MAHDFLSPFVHDLLETLANLISIGLDFIYFLFLSRDEIQLFLAGFVTYVMTATAMVM